MATNEKAKGEAEVLVENEVHMDEELLNAQPADTEDEVIEEEVVLSPLESALAQAEEFKNLAQRTRAELENYRRRTNKEREELLRFGAEGILNELLRVLDDVERAQQHAVDDSPLAEGFRMMHKSMWELMERHHVTEVPGVGEAFDPNVHNAIQNVESDAVEKGQVAEVYQKGYMLHERLLRPAMVAVAN